MLHFYCKFAIKFLNVNKNNYKRTKFVMQKYSKDTIIL